MSDVILWTRYVPLVSLTNLRGDFSRGPSGLLFYQIEVARTWNILPLNKRMFLWVLSILRYRLGVEMETFYLNFWIL